MNTNTKGKEYELIVRICEYDFVRTHLHIFMQICMYLYAICTHLNAIARICAYNQTYAFVYDFFPVSHLCAMR